MWKPPFISMRYLHDTMSIGPKVSFFRVVGLHIRQNRLTTYPVIINNYRVNKHNENFIHRFRLTVLQQWHVNTATRPDQIDDTCMTGLANQPYTKISHFPLYNFLHQDEQPYTYELSSYSN